MIAQKVPSLDYYHSYEPTIVSRYIKVKNDHATLTNKRWSDGHDRGAEGDGRLVDGS